MEKILNKPQFNIKTFGISTGRYVTFIPLPNDQALATLGSSIVLWDMENLKKLRVIQTNRSLITCLLRNSKFTVAISYSGEIKVLKNENFDIIGDYQSFRDGVRHASLGENYLVINSEKGEDQEGIEILRINNVNHQLQSVFRLKGCFRFTQMTKSDKLFVLERNLVEEKTIQKNGKPEQVKIKNYFMHIYDMAKIASGNTDPEKKILLPHCADIMSSTSDADTICFVYSDRFISVVNMDELNILYEGQILGMGGFLTSYLTAGKILHIPAENDVVIKIDLSNPPATKRIEDIPEYILCDSTIDHGKRVSVKGHKSPAIRKRSECFTLDYSGKKYYSINENGINTYEIATNKSKSLKISSITGCGVTTDPLEKYVAYGDLAGNVFIYSTDSNQDGLPNYSTTLPGSVRAVVWNPSNESLLIGLMNGGALYEWDFKKNTNPKLLLKLKRTITSLKFYPTPIQGKKYVLGASTTDGYFHLLVFEGGKIVSGPSSFIAHKPKDIEEDRKDDFGTLEYFAEIWSMCWDPKSHDKVVTCSEDQTSSVWDLSSKKPKEMFTLSGHTHAVTCVDWQIMDPSIGEIMISCSDDDTIRIYSPKEDFKLLDVLSTQFIKEWHTLTYCSIEKGGTRIAVASIIGYLFIYNLKTKQFEFSQKVHLGGIEGLTWTKNLIATCGSDNCVNLIKIT